MPTGRYIGSMIQKTKILGLTLAFFGVLLSVSPLSADGAVDKYKVTNAEKAACTADAIRLCMDAYPNEEKLIGCMKSNRDSLSTTCRVAFDAGIKRRHLR